MDDHDWAWRLGFIIIVLINLAIPIYAFWDNWKHPCIQTERRYHWKYERWNEYHACIQ